MNVETLRKLQELGLDLEQAIGVVEIMEEAKVGYTIGGDGRASVFGGGCSHDIGDIRTRAGQPGPVVTFNPPPRATVVEWTGGETEPKTYPMRSQDDDFAEFWRVYPRRVKKSRAMAVWAKVRLVYSAEEIMRRLDESSVPGIAAADPPTWLKSLLAPNQGSSP